ncbi:hypothetical protein BLNAU_13597 [Blattamonas nauphoetae]|uniref:Uncharacterized protein n=1 Tax=Blattamonas nauphoetae TaxID=2049346 RepID=A0ABQ9XJ18_9EUKA|nr:hypothetical protein BLNAU_13597 [Blattamonas nauphoetae]
MVVLSSKPLLQNALDCCEDDILRARTGDERVGHEGVGVGIAEEDGELLDGQRECWEFREFDLVSLSPLCQNFCQRDEERFHLVRCEGDPRLFQKVDEDEIGLEVAKRTAGSEVLVEGRDAGEDDEGVGEDGDVADVEERVARAEVGDEVQEGRVEKGNGRQRGAEGGDLVGRECWKEGVGEGEGVVLDRRHLRRERDWGEREGREREGVEEVVIESDCVERLLSLTLCDPSEGAVSARALLCFALRLRDALQLRINLPLNEPVESETGQVVVPEPVCEERTLVDELRPWTIGRRDERVVCIKQIGEAGEASVGDGAANVEGIGRCSDDIF